MKPLDYPDLHHRNAASGWLGLGNLAETRNELAQIAQPLLEHPEVLTVRWRLHAAENDWTKALEVSRRHLLVEPESHEPWINQSYALHELQQTDEAFRELRQVVDRFSEIGTIPYNLACYTCILGLKDEARTWLKRARKVMGKDELVAMAMHDPDLKDLKDEIVRL